MLVGLRRSLVRLEPSELRRPPTKENTVDAKQMLVPFVLTAVTGASAFALVGVLGLGHPVSAQDSAALERQVGLERIEDAESSVAVVFEGVVYDPSGAPAEGAVVVSSAGGQAVTDWNGTYRLEARVPVEAESVQITAVGRSRQNLLASAQRAAPRGSGSGARRSAAARPGRHVLAELAADLRRATRYRWRLVYALTVFDDGGGPALYAGGAFTTAGGVAANYVAKWDGSSWAPLGSGVSGTSSSVSALTVFDDGGGPALYAGGRFTSAGGVAANRIAKWDGSSWSALGSGMNGGGTTDVFALDGVRRRQRAALYAGGQLHDRRRRGGELHREVGRLELDGPRQRDEQPPSLP